MLLTENDEVAVKISNELNLYNKQRQDIQNKLFQEVESVAIKKSSDPILILNGKNWHEGVIGIVAAKIKEKFQKPTILISVNENKGKGSGRSM